MNRKRDVDLDRFYLMRCSLIIVNQNQIQVQRQQSATATMTAVLHPQVIHALPRGKLLNVANNPISLSLLPADFFRTLSTDVLVVVVFAALFRWNQQQQLFIHFKSLTSSLYPFAHHQLSCCWGSYCSNLEPYPTSPSVVLQLHQLVFGEKPSSRSSQLSFTVHSLYHRSALGSDTV